MLRQIAKISACVAAMTTAGLAWADATITVPENVIVLGVDGQETGNTGLFAQRKTVYHVAPGEHAITARYDRVFSLSSGDDDIVRSAGVTIRAVFADQTNYKLDWKNAPDEHEAAVKYAHRPTLMVTDEHGKPLAAQQGIARQSTSLLGSVMQGISVGDNNGTTLDRLQALWGQATTDQRQRFLNWIQQSQSGSAPSAAPATPATQDTVKPKSNMRPITAPAQ